MEFVSHCIWLQLATFFIFVTHLKQIGAYGTSNYCAKDLCSSGKKHIGCNAHRGFASTCIEPKIIPMSTKRKNLILMMHNRLRNLVASGNLSKFEPASNMSLMIWDNELAYLAELNVKQCQMEHDACRSTAQFKYAGQNLAFSWTSGSLKKHNENIRHNIMKWFMEHKDAKMDHIRKFGRTKKPIGHFTAMVRDASSHIGCAMSSYTKTRKGYKGKEFLMACNYATTNILNKSIYVDGKPCSACPKVGRCHTVYTALCDNRN
ncbi:venom allergen 5-like [Aedes aegypti]|uniref:SCP domain-containing protein n=1 Tax=Aedes aegypti TaxID=7159 RepID=A0A1S4F3R1_AEDAE|nr:venom allergen 5 [Aedes aegypti]XP_021712908.1 venom allergen 5-like [Aedes aegypti]